MKWYNYFALLKSLSLFSNDISIVHVCIKTCLIVFEEIHLHRAEFVGGDCH